MWTVAGLQKQIKPRYDRNPTLAPSYSDRESNPDQRFRKPPFYPLNYQSLNLYLQRYDLLFSCQKNIFLFFAADYPANMRMLLYK